MMERRLNLRFNLAREQDRRAWEYLQSRNADVADSDGSHKSKNRFIIQALNACAENETRKNDETAFIDRIIQEPRKELRTFDRTGIHHTNEVAPPQPVQEADEQERAEAEENLRCFLDLF